jgi:hypothetical protein
MDGLLCDAATWIGRKHSLTPIEFRHFFGIYPKTAMEISSLPTLCVLKRNWLLRTLWWLKEYPTDEEVKNHGSGDSFFCDQHVEMLHHLNSALPEVGFCFVGVLWVLVTLCYISSSHLINAVCSMQHMNPLLIGVLLS